MERRTFLKESSIAAAGIACAPILQLGCRPASRALPVIELAGSPLQRGRKHGEALRPMIRELVGQWKSRLASAWGDPDAYIQGFLNDTRFPEAVGRWTPGLMEEVRGIAEGSGIDFDTAFAFQCVDEEWWYSRNRRHGWKAAADKCSVVGVFGQAGLPTFVAQNMDLLSWADGFQVLLRIRHPDSDLESLVFTQAGLIAANGMNNRGIAECVNALLQLDPRVDGLPVAFINRGILEHETLEDAVDFVASVEHASGQAYTIGGPERAVTLECSARSVVPFEPVENATRLYHTNHPLSNPDRDIFEEYLRSIHPTGTDGHPNSRIRYAALDSRLKNTEHPATLKAIEDALGSHDDPDHPVCRHPAEDGSGGFTFGCTIFELGENPRLHLAPGPPCSTAFETWDFQPVEEERR